MRRRMSRATLIATVASAMATGTAGAALDYARVVEALEEEAR